MAKLWYKVWSKLFFLFFVFCIGIIFGQSSSHRIVRGKDGEFDIVKMPNTDEKDKTAKPKKIKKHKMGFQSEGDEPS